MGRSASTSVSRMLQIRNLQPSVSNGFLRCWNLQCWNLRCWNLQCWNLRCWNLRCWNMRCWNLRCWNMRAGFAPVHVRSLQIWHVSHFSLISSRDIPNSSNSMLKLMSFSSNVYITKNLHMFHTCPCLLRGWKRCRQWCSVGWHWLLANESSLSLSIFQPAKIRAFAKEPLLYLLFSPASEKISRISFIARATKVSSSFPFGTWQRKALRNFVFFRDSCFSCFCFLRFVIHFVDKAWGGADWVSRISFRSSLKLELQELHSLDNCCTSVVSCETLLEMSKPKAENFSHRKHRIFRHSNVHVWFILDLSIHLSNHRFIYNISYSSTYLLLFVLYQVFIIYLLCIHSSLHFSADVDIYH